MHFETITVEEREGGIGIITLYRPQVKNAISIEMRVEITSCLRAWKDRASIGAVVLTGSGNIFSSGFDLGDFQIRDRYPELLRSSSEYHREVWNFPKPTLAAVNGPAVGGGFDLATLCDMRICSTKAEFWHPEMALGAPPLITPLRWIVGEGLAREICFTGNRVDALEARRIGLVGEVTDGGALVSRAADICGLILKAPSRALRFAKGTYNRTAGFSFEEAFVEEHDRAFKEIILGIPHERT